MTTDKVNIIKEFEKGIFFSCQMCGGCCRGLDEGEIYLYKKDIMRFAKYLKISPKKFCLEYVKLVDDTFYWKEDSEKRGKTYKFKTLAFRFFGEDERCYFLKDNSCSLHECRAFQCRAFPIGWNMLINNLKNFTAYSKKCPALQKSLENEGKYYSKEEILKWATEEYEMEKKFFLEMKKHNFDIFKVYKFLPKDITC